MVEGKASSMTRVGGGEVDATHGESCGSSLPLVVAIAAFSVLMTQKSPSVSWSVSGWEAPTCVKRTGPRRMNSPMAAWLQEIFQPRNSGRTPTASACPHHRCHTNSRRSILRRPVPVQPLISVTGGIWKHQPPRQTIQTAPD